MHIDQASTVELSQRLNELEQQHQAFIDLQLTLDLTRGKPSSAQLDLANDLLDTVNVANVNNDHNIDPRNYGVLDGLATRCKRFIWFYFVRHRGRYSATCFCRR